MKKSLSIVLVLSFCLLSTATYSGAGSRYYSHHYSNYHPSYSHHRPYHHSHNLLPLLGVGLVAGAIAGSVMYAPPRQQTIVYRTPPPVIIHSDPVVTSSAIASVSPQAELVLRQVKITERLVNVRSGPGLDATIIGQTVAGQTVDVIGAAPEWLYIKTGIGQYGWVMTKYTEESGGPVG